MNQHSSPGTSENSSRPEDWEKAPGILAEESQNGEQADSVRQTYPTGLKQRVLTFGLCLSLFLVNFEISIVGTSLVSIVDSLQQFGRSSWIITVYLLTYTAFMVILAKLSDNLGRRLVLSSTMAVFVISSGACGAAQTMNQLIVFRAFQGIGASGVYSLVMIVIFEMVAPERYPKYSVLVTALYAISLVSGPLLGGAINNNSTWRWIFLLNCPAGAIGLVILFVCMPNDFPRGGPNNAGKKFELRNLDGVGATLMLAALALIIAGFEDASSLSPWTSAKVLAPIIVSVFIFIAFLVHERIITLRETNRPEPVLPWRLLTNRVIVGIIFNAFLTGGVITSCVIQIPLRFQAVHNESAWHAGVRLIPFGVGIPIGAGLTATICGKRRLPIIYMLVPSFVLQILGLVFMSRLNVAHITWKGQYGLQFITGLGCGFSIGVITLMTPFVIEKRDLATSTSTVFQSRLLGGALILAVITAAMNSKLKHELDQLVPAEEVARIFRSTKMIQTLAEPTRDRIRDAFNGGYNMQLRILAGFAGAEIPATLMMWQKQQVRIA